ncbi:hypothetical protein BO94DRAFT_227334 [Aspergillus sclerotioniger CBS 115572]|uniref:Uncharacterized protein n=1 Tax=Aspergillus sclerotioniger CBS 115572 TaxID=1450535 RepID=A0A317VNN5_9EURO|nr:hypothetical protein BO94DRAFT_227334 [Aspergillus sclerotioniger CBS 115572]PWY74478.1 hypothetical protein BO94DRAFT_227334 [Aspergillus sclerotioniger CBS 115572]
MIQTSMGGTRGDSKSQAPLTNDMNSRTTGRNLRRDSTRNPNRPKHKPENQTQKADPKKT